MDNTKVSIVIPAYNEEHGISHVLDDIENSLDESGISYEIIVVDDGSTDSTVELVKTKKDVKLVSHQLNRGYGAALKTGIKNSQGDLILITDADGTYPVKNISKLLGFIDQYDMVVGARTGKNIRSPLFRNTGRVLLTALANYLTGIKIPDLNSGFRVFKKDVALRFFNLFPSGFSFTTTITLACLTNDYSIKYVPINYYKRKGGSKINIVKDGSNFILLIVRTIMYFNPLKVFLPLALLLFSAALFVFLYSFLFLDKILDITVISLTIASIQIGVIGLLADLIVKQKQT